MNFEFWEKLKKLKGFTYFFARPVFDVVSSAAAGIAGFVS